MSKSKISTNIHKAHLFAVCSNADSDDGTMAALLLAIVVSARLRVSSIDLSDKIVEQLVYIDFCFCGRLQKCTVELARQVVSLVFSNNSFILQVTLVSNQNYWHIIGVFHSQDLIPQIDQVIERRLRRYAVDKHKALTILHVEITHCSELFRSGRVQNLQHTLLIVHFDLLSIAVFDRRVIAFHENALHELDSQR